MAATHPWVRGSEIYGRGGHMDAPPESSGPAMGPATEWQLHKVRERGSRREVRLA